jgi:hypothetical protein
VFSRKISFEYEQETNENTGNVNQQQQEKIILIIITTRRKKRS